LGTSFGRGGATTFQQDLQNSDCILIMGSNMAECHPVGFQWVMEAKERGAKVIHVDPRFTRTSAVSDLHVPLRAGSDIAFLGGIVHYILEHGREFRDYVVRYTNASVIVGDDFRDTEDLDGLFSGFDPETGKYDDRSWQYRGTDIGAHTETDPTLTHPRCVFQLLARHYERYTPEVVEALCGVPREVFVSVAEALCDASGPDRTAAFCYAVGWTQHTVACSTSARQRSCSCCWATSAGRVAVFSRCGATRRFRGRLTSRRSTTSFRVIYRCRFPTPTASTTTSIRTR
jgi:formate dehydrogenase major subunit